VTEEERTDEEFLRAFLECTLPEPEWTHRAHLRMAWLLLDTGSYAEVLPRVRAGIQRYNASLEKDIAYHETITQVFLRLIAHRIETGGRGESFGAFCESNPDLVERGLGALLRYYRVETLLSDAARAEFVEPDRERLPPVEGSKFKVEG